MNSIIVIPFYMLLTYLAKSLCFPQLVITKRKNFISLLVLT